MRPTSAPLPRSTSPTAGRLARASADPAPLFVYGTLLFPEVLRILIDRDPARTPASVPGWLAIGLPHVVYPTLVAQPDAIATGHLLTDLSTAEWQVLDAFEDDRYQLATIATTRGCTAYAYVESPAGHDGAEPWNLQTFTDTQLPAYLKRCTAWRQRYDARLR